MIKSILEWLFPQPEFVGGFREWQFIGNEKPIDGSVLFKGILSKPEAPAIAEPKALPDPTDETAMQRKRQATAQRLAQGGGREATMLSGRGETNKVGA